MRVGVDYRFLAVGPQLITRGMCRYTQQQLREVLALDHDNEYVLLCNQGTDLSLIAPDVRNPENVSIRIYRHPRHLPPPPGPDGELLARAEHYQAWVTEQDVDIYHATTPFLLEYPLLMRFDACPLVSTFYDLIPPLFPDHYFSGGHPYRDHYMRTLAGLIKGADRLLSISDAAGRDAITHLGIAPERIDRAWPIPDQVFRPMPDHLLAKLIYILQDRFRLPERYVLTVSYPHHTKNLETLLAAYAQLPQALRTQMPLVVCCHLDANGRKVVQALASSCGVADDVVLSGLVSDEELCALYCAATMVVHPSRYEGFGLPVVEAMRCGTPVITTTASSLPEVAGDAAILLDAEDPAAFAGAIAHLAGDAEARGELRRRGFLQAQRFDGAQLAQATLDSYQRTAQVAARPPSDRLHLALWTPLPPQGSGIADYSAELLEGLSKTCDVEVFVDSGFLPEDALLERFAVQHFSGFERRASQRPFDTIVFQVGGSVFHQYMAHALERYPGIVVLHDLMWSQVLYARGFEQGDLGEFQRELARLEGPAALDALLSLAPGDLAGLWDFLGRHPMLQPVIGNSLAQVVHFSAAVDELAASFPGSHPFLVPMGVADPYAANPIMRTRLARSRVAIDADAFVVSVFGIVHEAKRLEPCLRAFANLAVGRPDALLVVVGRWLEDTYRDHLAQLAERLGVAARVRFVGHVPRAELDAQLIAADLVVNLRTPSHMHMSATLMRALAAGKPVVITDLPEWGFIPPAACRRVPCDATEIAVLSETLNTLAGDAELRARMSAAARGFYEREGTIERMTQGYLGVIERVRHCSRAVNCPGTAPPG